MTCYTAIKWIYGKNGEKQLFKCNKCFSILSSILDQIVFYNIDMLMKKKDKRHLRDKWQGWIIWCIVSSKQLLQHKNNLLSWIEQRFSFYIQIMLINTKKS